MAKDKKPSDREISMDLKKPDSTPVMNTGSPKSKPQSGKGKVVEAPKTPALESDGEPADITAAQAAALKAPNPKDSPEIKSDRQKEAAALVKDLRTQKAPVVQETGNPTLDPDALKAVPEKKPINPSPTPPSADGEWVIMANYMSFNYGSIRYTFERGRPTLVPREVYKALKADGLV